MKSYTAKACLLALTCAIAGTSTVACSSNDAGQPSGSDKASQEQVGDVGLSLLLAPGVNIDSVTYNVRDSLNNIVVTGTIPVTDAGATISVLIGGLLPGTYTIDMTATSTTTPVVVCTGTSLPFVVTVGGTATAHVDLECTGEETRGEVRADGTWNFCPELTSWIAAPLVVGVGGEVHVSAAAADQDNFGGNSDAQIFAWTSTAGSFDDPAAAATNFNCSVAGTHTLTVAVCDGAESAQGPCCDETSFTVQCVSIGCGNGVIDPVTETCDPPGSVVGGVTCPADCTLPVCGDSIIESPEICDDGAGPLCPADCTPQVCGDTVVEGTETCDDGNLVNTDACPNDCTTAVCGDGVVEGSEACDDGNTANGDGCSSVCVIEVGPVVCGNGLVEAGEQCDPPLASDCGGGYDPLDSGLTAGCQDVTSDSCHTCEVANCGALLGSTGNSICDDATGVAAAGPAAGVSRKQLCYEAMECVRKEACVGVNGALDCYCGTAVGFSCFTGSANGACEDVLKRAHEATTEDAVPSNFLDVTTGGGLAMNALDCDFFNCASSSCF